MKNYFKYFFVLCIGMSVMPQPAGAESLENIKAMMQQMKADYEEKIKVLEAKINEIGNKQQEQAARINEKIGKEMLDVDYVGRNNAPVGKGGLLVKNPFGFGSVSVGGYVDFVYKDFENVDSTFDQHRWIINIGAELAERLRFNSEFEIEHGGPDAAGGGEAKVEQAYMDYIINDAINLRAGALLVPFGRYNLYHDSDLQDLTDRPIVARDIIPTTWTESGAGFFGEFNPSIASKDINLGYELYVINGLGTGFTDTGLSASRGSIKLDNNEDKAMVGRLKVSPAIGHEIAFSKYWGEYNKIEDRIDGTGVDFLSTWGPLELVGEYAYFGIEESPTAASDLANYYQGAYAQANYHFWPKFFDNTFLGRGFEHPTLTFINRYDWAKIGDDSDADSGDNEEDRYTLGLNYRPMESFVFKFEYQWNHAKNEWLENGDNNGFVTSVAMGF